MKLIVVPTEKVTLKLGGERTKELSFAEFLTTALDAYAEIKTPKQWRQASKVLAAIEKANGNISLEDADYELIKSAVAAGGGFLPVAGRQLVPYADAVENAEEVKA